MLQYQPGELPQLDTLPGLQRHWIGFCWDLCQEWPSRSAWFKQVVLLPGVVLSRHGDSFGDAFSTREVKGFTDRYEYPDGYASVKAQEITDKNLATGATLVCSPFLVDFSSLLLPDEGISLANKYAGEDGIFSVGDLASRIDHGSRKLDMFRVINAQREIVRVDHEVDPGKPDRWGAGPMS